MTDEEQFDASLTTLTYELQAARLLERSLRISANMVAAGDDTELEWEEAVRIYRETQRMVGSQIGYLRRLGRKIGKTTEQVDAIIADIEIRVYTEYDADKG